ncbi:RNA polymerase sigma factor [Candidatus Peregrinibacteria bacterium]|nr:RNA polymerase sigma factor [Candidatus Peregrinibacteria bacterium]
MLEAQSRSRAVDEFTDAFIAHRDGLLHHAMRFLQNPQDAEDSLNEVISKILKKFQGMDSDPDFNYLAYLYQSVKNQSLNTVRNKKRRDDKHSGFVTERFAPANQESHVHAAELLKIFNGTLVGIPSPRHREILRMRDMKEQTYLEIAEELDVPVGTVMSQIHRARNAFKAALPELI